jgi:glycolate oxidase iron-sulfur subunit
MRTELPRALLDTVAGATAERVLRSCVHCGMCNATCPTYQLTGDELDGPRGRIYLLKQALEGNPVTAITQVHLDRCLSCRSCETTCPSGVQYHTLYDIGRELLKTRAPRSWRERTLLAAIRAVAAVPARLRAAVTIGRIFAPLLPQRWRARVPPLATHERFAMRTHPRKMLLLTGCVQSVVASGFNSATARVFDRLGIELVEIAEAGCCGALDFHLDAQSHARERAKRNIDAWWPAIERGAEAIIVNASGCATFLRGYDTVLAGDPTYGPRAARVAQLIRDPVEVLLQSRIATVRRPTEIRIAVHDPCTLQHGLRLGGRVAELLRSLGYDPQPLADAHLCCGSAGAYSIVHADIAEQLRERKLAALTRSAPVAIYTGNIGCWLHLRQGTHLPVRHWIEAVDALCGE